MFPRKQKRLHLGHLGRKMVHTRRQPYRYSRALHHQALSTIRPCLKCPIPRHAGQRSRPSSPCIGAMYPRQHSDSSIMKQVPEIGGAGSGQKCHKRQNQGSNRTAKDQVERACHQ
uniref:Uncharacterized protein n=1 Tax=Knipowitschia caucasica TaxID=637954 RepID=A0AAV2KQQ9_KNICA